MLIILNKKKGELNKFKKQAKKRISVIEKSTLSIALISRLTSMDLRKSMDRWYLPVVTNRGLRQRPNSQTSYVPTTQEGARHKTLTTGAGLQRRRSTTRPNSNRVLRYQSIRARTLNWPPEVEHRPNDFYHCCMTWDKEKKYKIIKRINWGRK